MELYIVYSELHALLEARGIAIARNLVGPYMTALDMAGCSITLLRLDDELTALWDAPVRHDRPAVGRMTRRAANVPAAPEVRPGCGRTRPRSRASATT